MQAPTDEKPRVVLLGASNLTRGLSTAIESARVLLGRPLQVWLAAGHGRSYGMQSRVLFRTLPSILDCGLWPALAAHQSGATHALLTDIGNDIMYGAEPEQIRDWLAVCVGRLLQHGARVAVTALPTRSLERLGPRRYRLLQRLLFPGRDLPFEVVMERVGRLDRLLRELGHRLRLGLVEPRGEWFGFDSIHIRRRYWPAAWRELLAPWVPGEPAHQARGSLRRFLRLRACLPERSSWFGVELRREQPRVRLVDGTTVAMF